MSAIKILMHIGNKSLRSFMRTISTEGNKICEFISNDLCPIEIDVS